MLDTHLWATSFARQNIFQNFRQIGMKQKFFKMISQFVVDVRWCLSRCFELFRYRSIHLVNKVSKLEHHSIVQILCLVIKFL